MNIKKLLLFIVKVIFGMVAGILIGFVICVLFVGNGFVDVYIVNGLFDVGGKIFIVSLKMLVVLLVFVLLVCGMSLFKDFFILGRMGSKILGFYFVIIVIVIIFVFIMGSLF